MSTITSSAYPSFTLGDIHGMPRRPTVSSELLDSLRYVEVTGVPSTLSSRDIARMLPGVQEWRFMSSMLRTDIVALMPNGTAAREAAARINGSQHQGATLRATVADKWVATSADELREKLPHLKELRAEEGTNGVSLFYTLPKDSTVESQRRLAVALAAKNDTVGVAASRWVDTREAF